MELKSFTNWWGPYLCDHILKKKNMKQNGLTRKHVRKTQAKTLLEKCKPYVGVALKK